jgi:hypothetical protein
MGIRRFHLAFISISVVLAVFMASWAVGEYRADHGAMFIVTAVSCALAGALLVAYGAAFQRKTKSL